MGPFLFGIIRRLPFVWAGIALAQEGSQMMAQRRSSFNLLVTSRDLS